MTDSHSVSTPPAGASSAGASPAGASPVIGRLVSALRQRAVLTVRAVTAVALLSTAGAVIAPAATPAAFPSAVPAAHAQQQSNDPALQQTVSDSESVAPHGEHVVISAGHADLGPRFVDGEVRLMVRDDSEQPPVWRYLEDVTFAIGDDAIQTLPAGSDFDFTGAQAGDKVWVIPQTEVPGVPWLGWNTQSPEIVNRAQRGVALEFGGHQGPGDFTLFLQSGGFAAPQQLWNAQLAGSQPMWVSLNTHTHANWVFTQPGVHLVGVRVQLRTTDGEVKTDQQVIRLAVGSDTDPAQAHSARFDAPWRPPHEGAADGNLQNAAQEAAQADPGDPNSPKNPGDPNSPASIEDTASHAALAKQNATMMWLAIGVGILAIGVLAWSALSTRSSRNNRAAAHQRAHGEAQA